MVVTPAKLIDVFPAEEVVTICHGMVPTRYVAAHPMRPGAAYRSNIDMWATGNVFKAGHRIRFHVSSSEFPTYELDPNTGARVTHEHRRDGIRRPAGFPRRIPSLTSNPSRDSPLRA